MSAERTTSMSMRVESSKEAMRTGAGEESNPVPLVKRCSSKTEVLLQKE